MKFISDEDITRIKQTVANGQRGSTLNSDEDKRKLELKRLSDKRISGWTNTLESRRNARLKWKEENLAREEEKRKEIDRKEEALRNRLKEETIQRAKSLKFEENERVKMLRSQQLYTDVIETRECQVQEKEDSAKRQEIEKKKWHKQTLKTLKDEKERQQEQQKLLKIKAMENAQAMRKQKEEYEQAAERRKVKQLEEEKVLIEKIELENQKAAEELRRKKDEARKKARDDKAKLTLDLKHKRELERRAEEEEEKKRQREIERSAFIAKARADLELKHFKQKQEARKLLSDRASEELKIREKREVEIFIRDQKALQDKDREKREREEQQRMQLEKDIHDSRQKQIVNKLEQKRKEWETEMLMANEFEERCIAENAREKMKVAERRQRDIAYKRMQKEQIRISIENKELEKKEEIEQASQITKSLEKEDDLFREFALKEMERFQLQGKKTELLKKVLTI